LALSIRPVGAQTRSAPKPSDLQAIEFMHPTRLRAAQKDATHSEPLVLKSKAEDWVPDYYDSDNAKFRERRVFIPSNDDS
jgi:hypothetical protein